MIWTVTITVLAVVCILTGLGALNMLSLGGHMIAQGIGLSLVFLVCIFLIFVILLYTDPDDDE